MPPNTPATRIMLSVSLLGMPLTGTAADISELEITGRDINLIGQATAASEGRVSHDELALRPLLRTGEVLETVPGLVATQHSGSGKANQYYLRGFNLDHGTDFATYVDGMPVNMRSHGHGQGYTDLNFLIPELIEELSYRKGSYYADAGDFSAAGSAAISTAEHADPALSLAAGEFGFTRMLLSGQLLLADRADLIYGLEQQYYEGPWDRVDEDVDKTNLWLKYRRQTETSKLSVMLMAYDNSWNSADQIPQRAVSQGLISEYGSIDPSTGGNSSRYSLSASWQQELAQGHWQASGYLIDYDMQLWSNFTYATTAEGDQFGQFDQRRIAGGELFWQHDGAQQGNSNRLGLQLRMDDIDAVGLNSTEQRRFLAPIRNDAVQENSVGLYWRNTHQWTQDLRSTAGLRYDHFDFEVKARDAADISTLAANSGKTNEGILTASLNLSYSLNDNTELYASIGQGFHSNDARGTTISLDPVSASPVDRVDPLVDTLSREIGLRIFLSDRWNASAAYWQLDIDSELLFVGDAGNTEDTGMGSKRRGLEITSYYRISDSLSFDLEYAWTDARFTTPLDGSDEIPGALDQVLSSGLTLQMENGLSAGLRLRYFGDYPLDQGAVADSSTMLNLRLGWQATQQLKLTLDALNLFDSNDRDIQYFYESQLPQENSAIGDYHYHVFEPRALRLYVQYTFD